MPARSDPGGGQPGRQGGFLVSQVHLLGGRVFERLLREAGLGELSAARGRIVFALMQKDGISQNELAAMVKLDKSGLALTLGELEQEGLVARERSTTDRRQILVRRTKRFDDLSGRFTAVSEHMTKLYYAGINEGQVVIFERTLQQILTNLDNLEQSGNWSYTEP